jgi:hypothetical protein
MKIKFNRFSLKPWKFQSLSINGLYLLYLVLKLALSLIWSLTVYLLGLTNCAKVKYKKLICITNYKIFNIMQIIQLNLYIIYIF